jgi:hypothetical protein
VKEIEEQKMAALYTEHVAALYSEHVAALYTEHVAALFTEHVAALYTEHVAALLANRRPPCHEELLTCNSLHHIAVKVTIRDSTESEYN